MHLSEKKFNIVNNKINDIINKKQLKTNPKIIAVTKTHQKNTFSPLLNLGHVHFGENKMQEAESKWPELKEKYKNIQLHMLGKLQTNKAKKAVKLFDYIHSLDNIKLASKLSQFEKELNKKIKIFIQVNIGNEPQKSGISLNELDKFYSYCIGELSLNIVGLMCLPPLDSQSKNYFLSLRKAGEKLNLLEFSMGMSSDYEDAIFNGSTFVRIGTELFGERNV